MKHQLFFIGLVFTFVLFVFSNCSDIDYLDENPRLKSGSESGNSEFSNYSYTLNLFDNLKVERQGIWSRANGKVSGTMTNCEGMTVSISCGSYTVYGCIITDKYYSRWNTGSPWEQIYQITYISSSSLRSSDATFSTQLPPLPNKRRIWRDPILDSYYEVDESLRDLKVLATPTSTTGLVYEYCGSSRCGRHLVTKQTQGIFTISDFVNL
jgi:hypothetical protein